MTQRTQVRGILAISIMRMLLRVAAVFSVVALIVLSWLPGQDMIRTSLLSAYAEHALAYWISGLLVASALPRNVPHVAAFYVLLACVLELGQAFIPDRNPEIISGFVSICGALAGIASAALLRGSVHRKQRPKRVLLFAQEASPPTALRRRRA